MNVFRRKSRLRLSDGGSEVVHLDGMEFSEDKLIEAVRELTRKKTRYTAGIIEVGPKSKRVIEELGVRGNKVFRSSKLAFIDRSGQDCEATLVITSLGQGIVRENPQLLRKVEKALYVLKNAVKLPSYQPIDMVDLGNGITLKSLSRGGQSIVYLLEVSGRKFVVKIKAPVIKWNGNISQPYLYEMLQQQQLAAGLAKELEESNILLPKWLFSSSEVACLEFVEGSPPTQDELKACFTQELWAKLVAFKKRQSKVALWQNIEFDIFQNNVFKQNNFLRRTDGKIVWIDPFFYVGG